MNAMTKIVSTSATLSTRALLVSLSISQWSGRRLDRKVTKEVNDNHSAAADASRVNKLLLPPDALAGITKVVSATRSGFLERTLPWLDDGQRVMSSDAYLAHTSWIRKQRSKFDDEVEKFLADYDKHVADAKKRLGSMFDQNDYPTKAELRTKFSMSTNVLPVPTSGDFRAEMSDAQADMIRSQIEDTVSQATSVAIKDIYRRVHEVAERMVDRLTAYKPASKPGDRTEGQFRDSLVGNVRDLISILPSLNILGDPELAAMAEKLKPLAQHDAEDLRSSATLRRSVAAEAKAILDQVSDFLA